MTRITNMTGDVVSEIVSPRVVMEWDPLTDDGYVIFNMARTVTVAGVHVARQDFPNQIVEKISDLLARTFTVVVGQDADGNDITQDIPAALVMATIKEAFAVLYEEVVTPNPPPEMAVS